MCISEQKLNTKSTLIETLCVFKRGKSIKDMIQNNTNETASLIIAIK